MIKKAAVFLCIILCVLSLCSCMEIAVEELLSSPMLSEDQSSVIGAIQLQWEKFTLLYPADGDKRTPIQFIDMDGDGAFEATVFFTVDTDEGTAAKLAVLEKDVNAVWSIADVVDGAGTDINSMSVFKITHSAVSTVLVEWTASTENRRITAYRYLDNKIDVAFEDYCTDLIVYDLDSDGYSEFSYLKKENAFEPYVLNCIKTNERSFSSYGKQTFSDDIMDCPHFAGGKIDAKQAAVIVDEDLGNGFKITEIYTLDDGKLTKLSLDDEQPYTIQEISRRSVGSLETRSLFSDGIAYIPSGVPPEIEIATPETWTYWYSVSDGVLGYRLATYTESGYKMAIGVPDEWLARVNVERSDSEPRLVEMTDNTAEELLVSIKVLTVGEDSENYIFNGFKFLKQSGSYRYYAKFNCTQEEESFVRENFTVL